MSELPMPTTTAKKKNTQFSGANYLPLFIIFISSFLISKLTYFLPYLLNLLHFLSPLLITTFLVFLFTSYKTLIDKPAPIPNTDKDQEHHEVYSIFFEAASQFDQDQESQELVDKFLICVNDTATTEDRNNPPPEKTSEEEEEELFQEKDHQSSCETATSDLLLSEDDEKEVKEIDADSKKLVVLEFEEELETDNIAVNDVVLDKELGVSRRRLLQEKEDEKMMRMRSVVGSYGSMRVEKEWKRTLACKLFEERHNNNRNAGTAQGDDEEGMDLLWEAYDDDNNINNNSFSSKGDQKKMKIKKKLEKKLEKKRSVGSTKSSSRYDDEEAEDEDDEEEEEDRMSGKICCLQALKFSAGKVNLGMGRPNIGKISKAFRGIGWLHHVSTKKGTYSRAIN